LVSLFGCVVLLSLFSILALLCIEVQGEFRFGSGFAGLSFFFLREVMRGWGQWLGLGFGWCLLRLFWCEAGTGLDEGMQGIGGYLLRREMETFRGMRCGL
jgi:hypothetical protein